MQYFSGGFQVIYYYPRFLLNYIKLGYRWDGGSKVKLTSKRSKIIYILGNFELGTGPTGSNPVNDDANGRASRPFLHGRGSTPAWDLPYQPGGLFHPRLSWFILGKSPPNGLI